MVDWKYEPSLNKSFKYNFEGFSEISEIVLNGDFILSFQGFEIITNLSLI